MYERTHKLILDVEHVIHGYYISDLFDALLTKFEEKRCDIILFDDCLFGFLITMDIHRS